MCGQGQCLFQEPDELINYETPGNISKVILKKKK